jgi:hypothetical protein
LLFALVAGAAGITLFAYAADYGLYRYRLGTNRAFGQVTVTNYDAVQQKNGKTQFIFDPPRPQTCVHSLFSHAGYSPCWYLQRHSEQRTNI